MSRVAIARCVRSDAEVATVLSATARCSPVASSATSATRSGGMMKQHVSERGAPKVMGDLHGRELNGPTLTRSFLIQQALFHPPSQCACTIVVAGVASIDDCGSGCRHFGYTRSP